MKLINNYCHLEVTDCVAKSLLTDFLHKGESRITFFPVICHSVIFSFHWRSHLSGTSIKTQKTEGRFLTSDYISLFIRLNLLLCLYSVYKFSTDRRCLLAFVFVYWDSNTKATTQLNYSNDFLSILELLGPLQTKYKLSVGHWLEADWLDAILCIHPIYNYTTNVF